MAPRSPVFGELTQSRSVILGIFTILAWTIQSQDMGKGTKTSGLMFYRVSDHTHVDDTKRHISYRALSGGDMSLRRTVQNEDMRASTKHLHADEWEAFQPPSPPPPYDQPPSPPPDVAVEKAPVTKAPEKGHDKVGWCKLKHGDARLKAPDFQRFDFKILYTAFKFCFHFLLAPLQQGP